MLPYDVSFVKANDAVIDWFDSGSDTGKQFWVKQFVSDEPDVVNFDFADEMKANTPYIIAFPGDHWGSEYDVSGKTLKFIGQNVTVHKSGEASPVAGSYYSFIGDTKSVGIEDIYCLNLDGNKFDLDNSSAPFRAYFKANTSNCTKIYLSVGNGGGTTGISDVRCKKNCVPHSYLQVGEEGRSEIFDLSGRRVGSTLNKGVYIQNGKLFIKE